MKKISIRHLHEHTGKFVREAPSGGYIVTDRGHPVARIVPIDEPARGIRFADRVLRTEFARMKKIPGDSTIYLREDRDRR